MPNRAFPLTVKPDLPQPLSRIACAIVRDARTPLFCISAAASAPTRSMNFFCSCVMCIPPLRLNVVQVNGHSLRFLRVCLFDFHNVFRLCFPRIKADDRCPSVSQRRQGKRQAVKRRGQQPIRPRRTRRNRYRGPPKEPALNTLSSGGSACPLFVGRGRRPLNSRTAANPPTNPAATLKR